MSEGFLGDFSPVLSVLVLGPSCLKGIHMQLSGAAGINHYPAVSIDWF